MVPVFGSDDCGLDLPVLIGKFFMVAETLTPNLTVVASPIMPLRLVSTTPTQSYTDGNDSLTGTSVQDTLLGGNGSDTLNGGDSDDVLFGNLNTDYLIGGAGDDILYGGQNDGPAGSDGISRTGIDTLSGGQGADTLFGNHGSDVLYGDENGDQLYGGKDDDTLFGGDGGDTLFGDLGNDVLYGDSTTTASEVSADWLYGGDGTDMAVYAGNRATYTLELLSDGGIYVNRTDVLYGIEYLRFADMTLAATAI